MAQRRHPLNDAQSSPAPGFCQCGCGGRTAIATRNRTAKGYVKGEPIRFLPGHHRRLSVAAQTAALAELRSAWERAGIPYGYCLCGCGERTQRAVRTNATLGHREGEPYFYRSGHKKKSERWREQDCGFETPCWVWLLWRGQNGYGYMSRAGEQLLAHRVVFEERRGRSPRGCIYTTDAKTRCV